MAAIIQFINLEMIYQLSFLGFFFFKNLVSDIPCFYSVIFHVQISFVMFPSLYARERKILGIRYRTERTDIQLKNYMQHFALRTILKTESQSVVVISTSHVNLGVFIS